jgi:hypothetical protein
MKKLYVFILLIAAVNLYGQEMKLPPPVDNALFNQFVGKWVSDPYEMMGTKWVDEAEFNWILNHQFLEMKIVTTGDNGFVFKSYGIMAVDDKGNYKSWGFDDWGPTSVAYHEGKVEGNRLTSKGGNEFMKGSLDMIVEGETAKQDITFSYKDEQGKETSGSMKLVYHKK